MSAGSYQLKEPVLCIDSFAGSTSVTQVKSEWWKSLTPLSARIVDDKRPWRKDWLPVCDLLIVETAGSRLID